MIEFPEARTLARQITETLTGRVITDVVANFSPHKFAWFYKNPDLYAGLLTGKRIDGAQPNGGQVEIFAGDTRIVFTDGANPKYIQPGGKLPARHQLLIGFDDDSCIVASVQMYGGLSCFPAGSMDNFYYQVAKEKPMPLSDAFSKDYFSGLINDDLMQKKSVKALLATEQSIPGLGNGVLQDILFRAGLHPKRKVSTLTPADKECLFASLKNTLAEMVAQGGRSTEKDLFGVKGRYIPYLSKETANKACPVCGQIIRKESYLGGSVYYCTGCQPLE